MFSQNVHVNTVNYIYGLGGADVKMDDIEKIVDKLQDITKTGKIDKVKHFLINEKEEL